MAESLIARLAGYSIYAADVDPKRLAYLKKKYKIKIANDKWLTHLFLKENNFPVIPSALLSEASNFAKL